MHPPHHLDDPEGKIALLMAHTGLSEDIEAWHTGNLFKLYRQIGRSYAALP